MMLQFQDRADAREYFYMWREAFRIAALHIFVQEDRGPGAITPLRVVWRGISRDDNLQSVREAQQ